MDSPTPINSSDIESVFQIERFSHIDKDLLATLAKDYPTEWLVFVPQNPNPDDLPLLAKECHNTYFVQLGFIGTPNNIQYKKRESPNITEEVFSSKKNLIECFYSIYQKELSQPWTQYIPKNMHQSNIEIISEVSTLENSLFLKSEVTSEIMALVLNFPSQLCTGENIEQVGWIWIHQNLTKEDRQVAREKIKYWLASRKAKTFQSGIHLENNRSQKFFTNIGFTLRCAHILKR